MTRLHVRRQRRPRCPLAETVRLLLLTLSSCASLRYGHSIQTGLPSRATQCGHLLLRCPLPLRHAQHQRLLPAGRAEDVHLNGAQLWLMSSPRAGTGSREKADGSRQARSGTKLPSALGSGLLPLLRLVLMQSLHVQVEKCSAVRGRGRRRRGGGGRGRGQKTQRCAWALVVVVMSETAATAASDAACVMED